MFKHENLRGRVAVVTGGGGILCAGFAKTLAEDARKLTYVKKITCQPKLENEDYRSK